MISARHDAGLSQKALGVLVIDILERLDGHLHARVRALEHLAELSTANLLDADHRLAWDFPGCQRFVVDLTAISTNDKCSKAHKLARGPPF